jgi:CheY-like chemotaxis protein
MAKILLVEDDSIIVKIYTNYLVGKGHEVKAVAEGNKALETALEFHPQVILLDLMVPKLGGTKILEELRSKAEFKNIPILVYTNLDSQEKEREVLEKGATKFVSKAKSNPKEVIAVIEGYLTK